MKKRPKVTSDATPLSSNPFAGLASLLPDAPPGPSGDSEPTATAVAEETHSAPDGLELSTVSRLVVRRQKRGQGGKTVTYVEGLPAESMPVLLERMKRALGCGGRLDGAMLVIGTKAHADVAQWLRNEGAPNVVLGN